MDYNAQYQAYLNTAETALAQQADRCFNERSRVCEAARYSLFGGGLMLGAFFMATDYVTSPFTFTGRIVYGVCLGVITCIIRFYGNMAEGVSFALLLMNLLVPYINDLTRQKPLGGAKAK